MAKIKYLKDVGSNIVYPVTHEKAVKDSSGVTLESKLAGLESKSYVTAWDGTSAPTASNIPYGVTVTYNGTTYTGTKTASSSTIGKIYLVKNGDNYDRYITSQSGNSYSWQSIGSTAVTLDVVDDDITGGNAVSWSAERGKVIREDVTAIETQTIGKVVTYTVNSQNTTIPGIDTYKDNYNLRTRADKDVRKNIADITTSSNSGVRNFILPCKGASIATMTMVSSSAFYGSLFTDDTGTVLDAFYRTSDVENPVTVKVPKGATKLYWSTKPSIYSESNATCTITFPSKIEELETANEATRAISRQLNGGYIEYRFVDLASDPSVERLNPGKRTSTAPSHIGTVIDEATFADSDHTVNNIIPIPSGAKSVSLTMMANSAYGSAFLDTNRTIVKEILRTSSSEPNPYTAEIPNNAAYVYWSLASAESVGGTWSNPVCRFNYDYTKLDSNHLDGSAVQTNYLQAIGAGDTGVYSNLFHGLVNGKTYSVTICRPNIPVDELTLSSSYYKFALYLNAPNGTSTVLYYTYIGSALPEACSFTVPNDGVSYSMSMYMRANTGERQVICIDDSSSVSPSGTDYSQDIAALKETINGVVEYGTGEAAIAASFETYSTHPTGQLGANASVLFTTGTYQASTNYHNYVVPVSGYKYLEVDQYGSANRAYGSIFIDTDGNIVDTVTRNPDTESRIVGSVIPITAEYFIYSVYNDNTVSYIKLYKEPDSLKAERDSQEEMIREVTGGSVTYNYSNFADKLRLSELNVSQLKVFGATGSILSVDIYKSLNYRNFLVPVSGWERISFRQYATTGNYGSAFVDSELNIVQSFKSSSNTTLTRTIPSDAAYLVWSIVNSDAAFTLYADESLSSDVNLLSSKLEELSSSASTDSGSTGLSPMLYKGYVGTNGATVESNNYLTTETIFGPFQIQLADDYRIYSGHLFDRKGNIVSYQYIHPDIYCAGRNRSTWSNGIYFTTAKCVPDYGYRLVICKSDQSAIPDGARVVKNFVSLKDAGLHRWIPSDLPNYNIALDRIDMSQRITWTPLAKVPAWNSAGTTNNYFHLEDQLQIGVPYSDVAQTRKYVPNNVSVRTFLTAVKNKRSLLYTEDLVSNTSQYGMSYTGGNRRSYYGEVCSGFTAWVMGLDTLYLSTVYNGNGIPGLSTVSNASAANVRPLDLIWNEGHISIISDIYKDEFDNVKYIVWAEMSTPYTYRSMYTPAQFEARLAAVNGRVHRWTGWANLQAPADYTQYVPYGFGTTLQDYDYCPDIMTFAGDYAAFAEGDTIYLNCKRNASYTSVLLYKDNGAEPIQTIDISTLDSDGMYVSDSEDWVKLNLTTYNLTPGLYKACMYDGTSSSGYTYFEVIGITFTAALSGTDLVMTFSATGGTPVSIEQTQISGFANKYHPVTAAEVTAGTITEEWSYSSTYPKLYILVKGTYGTVCKAIDVPQS